MNKKLKQMTGTALLMALVVVLQFVGGMIPAVGGFTISLVLIPIVMGGAVYGARTGALLGAVFGIVVLTGCISGTDPGGAMVFQAGPVLCILVVLGKGIAAGWLSGAVYGLVSKKNGILAMLLVAAICPVANTGIFVVCMMVFFRDILAAWAGGGDILAYVLTGLVLCNFVPELIINLLFSMAGSRLVPYLRKG